MQGQLQNTLFFIVIQFKGYVHLEHPWLSSLWAIYGMCYQRFYRMPTLWPNYKITIFILVGLKSFNGEMENRVVHVWVTTLDTMKWGKEWEVWLQGPWNGSSSKHDHLHKHGIKWHSIMFKLPYWEVSLFQPNHRIIISFVLFTCLH